MSADGVEVNTGESSAPADDVLALGRAGVSVAVVVARAPRRRPLRDGPFPLPKFKLVIVDAIVKALHLKKRKAVSQNVDWSFAGSRSPEG